MSPLNIFFRLARSADAFPGSVRTVELSATATMLTLGMATVA